MSALPEFNSHPLNLKPSGGVFSVTFNSESSKYCPLPEPLLTVKLSFGLVAPKSKI